MQAFFSVTEGSFGHVWATAHLGMEALYALGFGEHHTVVILEGVRVGWEGDKIRGAHVPGWGVLYRYCSRDSKRNTAVVCCTDEGGPCKVSGGSEWPWAGSGVDHRMHGCETAAEARGVQWRLRNGDSRHGSWKQVWLLVPCPILQPGA